MAIFEDQIIEKIKILDAEVKGGGRRGGLPSLPSLEIERKGREGGFS